MNQKRLWQESGELDSLVFVGVEHYLHSKAIEEMHSAYPKTEFAIEISTLNDHSDGLDNWRQFTLDTGVPMAIHLRNPIDKEVITYPAYRQRVMEHCEGFGRVQIGRDAFDFHDELTDFIEEVPCPKVTLANSVNEDCAFRHPKLEHLFDFHFNAGPGFYFNTGRGTIDSQPSEGRFGYAGDFDVFNITEMLQLIESQEYRQIWLDIDYGVKDELGRFVVDKALQLCQTVFES